MAKKKDKNLGEIGGGITQFKMSCDVNWDIDKVYDAANWMVGLAELLIEEMKVQQRPNNVGVLVEALDVVKYAKMMASSAQRMRWEEQRRIFGSRNS